MTETSTSPNPSDRPARPPSPARRPRRRGRSMPSASSPAANATPTSPSAAAGWCTSTPARSGRPTCWCTAATSPPWSDRAGSGPGRHRRQRPLRCADVHRRPLPPRVHDAHARRDRPPHRPPGHDHAARRSRVHRQRARRRRHGLRGATTTPLRLFAQVSPDVPRRGRQRPQRRPREQEEILRGCGCPPP